MGWVAAVGVAVAAYGAYSSNQNAQDAQAQQQQAMDRADPFGNKRGEYTQGLRDAVNAGNNPGGYLAGNQPFGGFPGGGTGSASGPSSGAAFANPFPRSGPVGANGLPVLGDPSTWQTAGGGAQTGPAAGSSFNGGFGANPFPRSAYDSGGIAQPSVVNGTQAGGGFASPAMGGPGGLQNTGNGATRGGPGGLQYYASGMPAPVQGPDYSNLQNLAGNIQNNPAYQFRMQQGMDNAGRQASAKGMLQSGNYLKDLTDYAQGLASTEYDREYQRQFGLSNQQFANSVEGQGQAFRNSTLANQQAQDRFNRYALLTGAQHVMPGSAITSAASNAFGYNAASQDNLGRLGGAALNAYSNYQANHPTSQPQTGQAVQSSAGGY